VSDSPRAGSLPLVAGALALDFCNTRSGRGTKRHIEHLFDFEDLLRWSAHAGAVSAEEAEQLQPLAGETSSAAAFARAMHVREIVDRICDAVTNGAAVDDRLVASFEREIEYARRSFQLAIMPTGLRWVRRLPPTADSLVDLLVQSAEDVFATAALTRLKRCPGEACGWVFLDQTKNASRVWCEMAVCGTRAKLRSRARKARRRAHEH
jgi:predicted RNA-binding Zn ribbon-like protein